MNNEIQQSISLRWFYHMRNGDFEKAWQVSDYYLAANANTWRRDIPLHYQNFWNGTPLCNKRVLIRCYHGLGDTIQFIRYVPLVKAIADEVIVMVPAELIPLLQTVNGIDKLLELKSDLPTDVYDVDVEVMELPHIFRTTLQSIPCSIPYLHVAPVQLNSPGVMKVGLVWKGGDWDTMRSVPFQALTPLANIRGIELNILQADAVAAGWHEGFGTYRGDYSLYDFARLVRSMHLVVTIDSMSAHLAGALGVPVWLLLHTKADWRWLKNCEHSPWYPGMRIFRQHKAGDWHTVVQRVCKKLWTMAARR